jgi:hypothetical protein
MGLKYCSEGHIMEPSWKYCPVCLAPLSGWLVTLGEDSQLGKFYTIHEGKSFIGSGADCEIRILHSGLSRQHAYLVIADGLCTMVDLGNGEPIQVNNIDTVKTTLIDGDILKMGNTLFKIKLL